MLNPVVGGPLPTRGLLAYGYQRSPTHIHRGIDIHAPEGTRVRAVVAGTVVRTGHNLTRGFSGYGRFVVLRKGERGPWFLHAHLQDVDVRAGQRVSYGQKLGTVGRTCFNREDPHRLCNRAHLHFEVSPRSYPQGSEQSRLDPVPFIQRAGRSGLLPLLGIGAGAAGAWWLWRRSR